ncbi:MAG: hypothetical protein SGPRY_006529 [Prymnesium sp.]
MIDEDIPKLIKQLTTLQKRQQGGASRTTFRPVRKQRPYPVEGAEAQPLDSRQSVVGASRYNQYRSYQRPPARPNSEATQAATASQPPWSRTFEEAQQQQMPPQGRPTSPQYAAGPAPSRSFESSAGDAAARPAFQMGDGRGPQAGFAQPASASSAGAAPLSTNAFKSPPPREATPSGAAESTEPSNGWGQSGLPAAGIGGSVQASSGSSVPSFAQVEASSVQTRYASANGEDHVAEAANDIGRSNAGGGYASSYETANARSMPSYPREKGPTDPLSPVVRKLAGQQFAPS